MAQVRRIQTTLYLDADLKRRLSQAAKRRGLKEASIVRLALDKHLSAEEQPPIEAIGKSSDGGVARSVDETLAKLSFGS